jgi:hypothetical protein
MSDKISARENEASSEAGSSAQDAATANSDTTANAQDAPSNSVAGLGNTNPGSSGRAVMLPHPKSLPTVQVAFRKGTVYIGSSPTKHSFSLAKGPRAGMNGNGKHETKLLACKQWRWQTNVTTIHSLVVVLMPLAWQQEIHRHLASQPPHYLAGLLIDTLSSAS